MMNGVKCLKAMELFLEGKNKNYALMLELINWLYFGSKKSLSRSEISDMVERYGISAEFNLSQSLMNENELYNLYLLDKNIDGDYSLHIESSVPIQPYKMEKQWLKHILKNPKLKLFLEDVTIAKLKALLADYDNIVSEDALTINRPCIQLQQVEEGLSRNFKLLVKAILENKGIEYSYTTRSNELLQNCRGIPYKIEYSMKEDCFYLISYSLEDKRPIKSLLSGFKDIKLMDLEVEYNISPEEIQKSIDAKKAAKPILLRIKDVNNTLERALFQFSCFERELDYIEESDAYLLSIFYYEFEREEVISRIFSLGKHAIVVELEDIKAEIIKRLQQLKEKYSSIP